MSRPNSQVYVPPLTTHAPHRQWEGGDTVGPLDITFIEKPQNCHMKPALRYSGVMVDPLQLGFVMRLGGYPDFMLCSYLYGWYLIFKRITSTSRCTSTLQSRHMTGQQGPVASRFLEGREEDRKTGDQEGRKKESWLRLALTEDPKRNVECKRGSPAPFGNGSLRSLEKLRLRVMIVHWTSLFLTVSCLDSWGSQKDSIVLIASCAN
ncbi:hypothetical protein BJ875DRAFT_520498 [Amylocarpus encephaloides]|uniref:Uncharacterized protein n=1 Tax=Amylocarpus encephaloides TaxID=45428 RepID=A0A9P7YBQ9_9HELO|nr:hypothetical protein BJ875DRAFT_520498 [Amylocarpus encephaloides]